MPISSDRVCQFGKTISFDPFRAGDYDDLMTLYEEALINF
jgi:hypothetical protein